MMWIMMLIVGIAMILVGIIFFGAAFNTYPRVKFESIVMAAIAVGVMTFAVLLLLEVPNAKHEEHLCKAAGGVYDGTCTLQIDLDK